MPPFWHLQAALPSAVMRLRSSSPQALSKSLGAALLLIVVAPPWPLLPWSLPPALPAQTEYPAMRYLSKLLASLALRPGMAPPRQRAGKSAVVSFPLLRSNAPGVVLGMGIRHHTRALPQQLHHELWEREEHANLGCDDDRASKTRSNNTTVML